jgi:hypothetical protein
MKRAIVTIILLAAVYVFAQGRNDLDGTHDWRKYTTPYDPKAPPPLGLAEAYARTLAYLGPATNRFYCVGSGCLEKGRSGYPSWTFCFYNTNKEIAYVEISFDKEIATDSQTEHLLGKR